MLGSAAPAASVHTSTATSNATSASLPRPSRLRGLSYLRSLHSHSHPHPARSSSDTPPLSRSTSYPAPANAPPAGTTPHRPTNAGERGASGLGSGSGCGQPVSPSQNGDGWIPTIQGRSGLSRESLHPTSTSTASASPEPSTPGVMTLTRSRAVGNLAPTPTHTHTHTHTPTPTSPPANHPHASSQRRASSAADTTSTPRADMPEPGSSRDNLPSIRFIPHVETRSSRPSLQFTALSRTLKTPTQVVKVGRYSERDHHTGDPATFPVGFKSKVVSRRHCEFWCTEGQWYIKDVKSSSGTFLNHVRLSSPGLESRPYPVNDGDVVQLGIDFKGGEEVIFRCVKIRVEVNRGWQKSLNSFNTSAHKRLLKSAVGAKNRDSDAGSVNSSECSICLNPVAPCQALFVAPCSHVWHYKCIRNLIHSPQWPNFLCPNCRFMADLEADVEQPEDEDWDEESPEEMARSQSHAQGEPSGSSDESAEAQHSDDGEHIRTNALPRNSSRNRNQQTDEDLAALMGHTALDTPSPMHENRPPRLNHGESSSITQPINIASNGGSRTTSDPIGPRSMTPTSHAPFALAAGPIVEGPMTPRNDAGPFILDGTAGRERNVAPPVQEVSEPASLEEKSLRRT
ncbi:E3 ubiquitin- ligase DMA1 [Lecanosticta acicola]|uniref:E3 ubiquitin- ligase DMA1 n=1 Tax=Lecanosticta acicola TaxID=111012 RepID=A0AAI8YRW0_9PEZI|nr:E3 ubiquitin- ligase DMA1 [Lecanosticta acicola]